MTDIISTSPSGWENSAQDDDRVWSDFDMAETKRDWDPDEPGFVWNDRVGETQRVDNKTYIRIPGGEIQVGHVSGRVIAWVDGERITLRSPEGRTSIGILKEREAVSQDMIRLWHGRYKEALSLLREVSAGHVLAQVAFVEHLGVKVSKDLWDRIGRFVGRD